MVLLIIIPMKNGYFIGKLYPIFRHPHLDSLKTGFQTSSRWSHFWTLWKHMALRCMRGVSKKKGPQIPVFSVKKHAFILLLGNSSKSNSWQCLNRFWKHILISSWKWHWCFLFRYFTIYHFTIYFWTHRNISKSLLLKTNLLFWKRHFLLCFKALALLFRGPSMPTPRIIEHPRAYCVGGFSIGGKILVVGGWAYPSEKYEFVNGKDDIPYMKWKIKFMFQTTNLFWYSSFLFYFVGEFPICSSNHPSLCETSLPAPPKPRWTCRKPFDSEAFRRAHRPFEAVGDVAMRWSWRWLQDVNQPRLSKKTHDQCPKIS